MTPETGIVQRSAPNDGPRESFTGRRVVVMGLGRFGGGVGVTRWLCRQGARVLVTDLAEERDLRQSISALDGLSLELRLGRHDASALEGCDVLVVSPAVDKRTSAFFRSAIERGIPWTSEMNLFLERCPSRVVGITGTVGKSTTTAMLGLILGDASRRVSWPHGRVWLGGNIGKSLLEDHDAMRPEDVVVLELSSFQLEDAAGLRMRPSIAVVTNLRENHLDRHVSLQAYAEAKAHIYRYQTEEDWLVMPLDCGEDTLPGRWHARESLVHYHVDEENRAVVERCGRVSDRRTEIIGVRLSIPGRHNVHNAAAALAASRILGVEATDAAGSLTTFRGLPHRLEFVRAYRGVKYYNDSKATSPEAAMTSLKAFDGPIILLAGGSDKGLSFEAFGRFVAEKAKEVVCMGQTRDLLARAVAKALNGGRQPQIKNAESFQDSIETARADAEAGDVVLLSPGCASFDWFRNYESRGERFKAIVSSWS